MRTMISTHRPLERTPVARTNTGGSILFLKIDAQPNVADLLRPTNNAKKLKSKLLREKERIQRSERVRNRKVDRETKSKRSNASASAQNRW